MANSVNSSALQKQPQSDLRSPQSDFRSLAQDFSYNKSSSTPMGLTRSQSLSSNFSDLARSPTPEENQGNSGKIQIHLSYEGKLFSSIKARCESVSHLGQQCPELDEIIKSPFLSGTFGSDFWSTQYKKLSPDWPSAVSSSPQSSSKKSSDSTKNFYILAKSPVENTSGRVTPRGNGKETVGEGVCCEVILGDVEITPTDEGADLDITPIIIKPAVIKQLPIGAEQKRKLLQALRSPNNQGSDHPPTYTRTDLPESPRDGTQAKPLPNAEALANEIRVLENLPKLKNVIEFFKTHPETQHLKLEGLAKLEALDQNILTQLDPDGQLDFDDLLRSFKTTLGLNPADVRALSERLKSLYQNSHAKLVACLEYCDLKDLMSVLNTNIMESFMAEGFLLPLVFILSGVWNGLKSLHEHGVDQNDSNPQNILLKSEEFTSVITDFGRAYRYNKDNNSQYESLIIDRTEALKPENEHVQNAIPARRLNFLIESIVELYAYRFNDPDIAEKLFTAAIDLANALEQALQILDPEADIRKLNV